MLKPTKQERLILLALGLLILCGVVGMAVL